ncbi:Peptidylprolyl isomerase domain and WD repeat-containing protein 1 [Nibea albiflora]|uniref:Peptidylprolyl isomerase domain and WD repeat-containing protein 1 n=1 Tax=Nibea albiflora TaxID=240163 RepID=A0ACB7F7M1_NIBAL|nr:Peptidylprolyl isomerase domain and WD repeat-containing protein 1 [Nibea albiflora]
MKVFDVVNFDMINMLKLGFHPGQSEWIYNPGDAISTWPAQKNPRGRSSSTTGEEATSRSTSSIRCTPPRCHKSASTPIQSHRLRRQAGMLEYWTGSRMNSSSPSTYTGSTKQTRTCMNSPNTKTYPTSLAFSPDGAKMATIASDRKVRIFRFLTGKLMRVFDESLTSCSREAAAARHGVRAADGCGERAGEGVDGIRLTNIIFDETGTLRCFTGTMLGIKVINVGDQQMCADPRGSWRTSAWSSLSLFQGVAKAMHVAPTVEMTGVRQPRLENVEPDPTIFCTAFKKNRFYMFTKREPEGHEERRPSDRDIFNEKPSKEEVMAATQAEGPKRVSDSAIIHTTMGDIHIKLFPVECPKTVENFCVHSRNGYYKRPHIPQSDQGERSQQVNEEHPAVASTTSTHRVRKMHERHWRPSRGYLNMKVNPKTDKPYEDISIINITIK